MFEQKTDQTKNPHRPEHSFSSAIIFGAANGIGKAIEDTLFNQGTPLILSIDRASAFQRPGTRHWEGGTSYLRADITDPEQLTTITKGAPSASLDLAVFNAGIMREEDPELTHQVNVQGTKNCFEAVSALLKPGAHVIFLSSDLITVPATEANNLPKAYVASKRAVAEFAESLVKDRPDLRILTLLPGPVKTNLFLEGKSGDLLDTIEKTVGIFSPSEFTQMLFQEVIPQFASRPSGATVRMYKRSGVEWLS